MTRLTDRNSGYLVNDELFATGYIAKEQTGAYSKEVIEEVIDRLVELEDILYSPDGTEFITHDRLRELVEAYKENRVVVLPRGLETEGDEHMTTELCPVCGCQSDYPDGGVCKKCYKKLREEGYWAERFERVKQWLS